MRVLCANIFKNKSRKGFSLSEVLISIGLMAFVGTAAIGGLVVVSDVRDKIDKQNKAEMIMYATEGYLRADLNNCTNPSDMDCSVDRGFDTGVNNAYGTVSFIMAPGSNRYISFMTCNNKDFYNVTAFSHGTSSGAKVQYWNSPKGICVGVQFDSVTVDNTGYGTPSNRKYILAEMVVQGTGMYTVIGDDSLNVGATYVKGTMDESIKWDDTEKMFTFWIYIIDKNDNNKVIMKHKVEVCPDPLMPVTIP